MSDVIRFILDGQIQAVHNVDPELTLLNFLRTHWRRTGTKEGCAEGDCGACTIVIGEMRRGAVHYRAINACIFFLPMLDGKELMTVESLRGRDGWLHPVQQALVDHHASQCGFCTPGIVMSLYAHYLNRGPVDVATLNDVLAGNLCRCTGYRPIVAAAQVMYDYPSPSGGLGDTETQTLLASIQRTSMLALVHECTRSGVTKKFFAPRTRDELSETLGAHDDAVILAGGTDVGLWVTKQHRMLKTVISVGDVKDFDLWVDTDSTIEIGAGMRYGQAMARLGSYYPDMGALIRRIGSVQIRNSGTIGGNIANGSPIGDMMPVLIASGAILVLRKRNKTREMPLEDYFISYGKQDRQPGEFVEKIILPKPCAHQVFWAHKISKRFDQDISAVCGAFNFTIEKGHVKAARICYGGMAATPKRARACEDSLMGKLWSYAVVQDAMRALEKDYQPLSDMRASESYRMTVAKNLLYKCFLADTKNEEPLDILELAVESHG